MKNSVKKRFRIFILAFTLIFYLIGTIPAQAIDFTDKDIPGITDIQNKGTVPELTAEAAILIDAKTGQILFAKNEHDQKYPASTTKIMTGLLAIENLDINTVLTGDKETASVGGSKILISEGEQIGVKDLLYALLLDSANDAAVLLGKGVAGTTEEFVSLMNTRAAEAGAKDTHFNNPNGLPDETHVTTAYDLAFIAREAVKNDMFREIISTLEYSIPATNMYQLRELKNGNRMLWDKNETLKMDDEVKIARYYEGTYGIKTGYTNAAKSCLVAAVKRGNQDFIGVVLASEPEYHYADMIKLFNYGFKTYETAVLCDAKNYQYTIKVKKSETKSMSVGVEDDVTLSLPKGIGTEDVTTEVSIEKKYEAPIELNQTIGNVAVYYGGQLLDNVDIVALDSAPLRESIDIQTLLLTVLKVGGLILVGLILLYIIIVTIVNFLYNRKRKIRKKKRSRVTKNESDTKTVSGRGAYMSDQKYNYEKRRNSVNYMNAAEKRTKTNYAPKTDRTKRGSQKSPFDL